MKGFVSYSHNDMDVCRKLEAHLIAFSDIEFQIDYGELRSGDNLDSAIAQMIADARVHVLLVSPYSIVSPYIMNVEIPAIVHKKKADGDLVLPLVVSDCRHQLITGGLVAAPHDFRQRLKPVRNWRPHDTGLNKACTEFANSIQAHFGFDPYGSGVDWNPS